MNAHCPGAASLRTPELAVKRCPACGADVELFSNEPCAECLVCAFTVYRDTASCIAWCRYAEECVGTETYRRLMQRAADKTD